jgi:hypothetical protein
LTDPREIHAWLRRSLMLLTLAGVLATGGRAHAGAWTRDQWGFYLQLSTSFSDAEKAFDASGKRQQIGVQAINGATTGMPNPSNFQQLLTDAYLELGILPRVTFFGDFQIYNSERQKNGHTALYPNGGNIDYSAGGVGDLLLGLRVGLLQGPLAIALESRLTLPTGDANQIIPLGQGDTRAELRFVTSKAFERLPIFVDFEFGLTLRGNADLKNTLFPAGKTVNYSPEFVIHGEAGATLVRWKYDRVILVAVVEHRQSTAKPVADMFNTIIPAASSFTTVGGNLLVYVIRNAGVNLRFSQAVAGALLPSVTSFGAGLFATY